MAALSRARATRRSGCDCSSWKAFAFGGATSILCLFCALMIRPWRRTRNAASASVLWIVVRYRSVSLFSGGAVRRSMAREPRRQQRGRRAARPRPLRLPILLRVEAPLPSPTAVRPIAAAIHRQPRVLRIEFAEVIVGAEPTGWMGGGNAVAGAGRRPATSVDRPRSNDCLCCFPWILSSSLLLRRSGSRSSAWLGLWAGGLTRRIGTHAVPASFLASACRSRCLVSRPSSPVFRASASFR